MSYQEKRSVVSIFTAILTLGSYCAYAHGKMQSDAIATDQLNIWAGIMLMFIGIGIAAAMVIQLIFHFLLSVTVAVQEKRQKGICDETEMERKIESDMVTDERDKLIELKSMKVGFIVISIGFVIALISQVLNHSSAVMLNIVFISFYASAIIGGLIQIYYYRKGVRNG